MRNGGRIQTDRQTHTEIAGIIDRYTEKYVEDVKLNKDKYNNYWIKTIIVNNMSSSISFSGRAFGISGRTSIKVAPTKFSPLLLAIYSKLEKAMKQEKVSKNQNLMDEAFERKVKTI